MTEYVALDFETYLINTLYEEPVGHTGLTPPPVCLAYQRMQHAPRLVKGRTEMAGVMRTLLKRRDVLVLHNGPFDLMVAVTHLGIPFSDVIGKYNRGEIRDTQVREMLLAYATGEAITNPGKKYSLAALVEKHLGKDISAGKGEDAWRFRYAELAATPLSDWPAEAVQYPKDDVNHTLRVFAKQHKERKFFEANELAQTRALFDLHLISMNSPRVDPAAVDAFERKHTEIAEKARAPLIRAGIFRENPHRWKQYDKGDPRRTGYSLDQKRLRIAVQKDYEKRGLQVPLTEKGSVSTAADVLLGCRNRLLREYGEAASSEKMVSAFLPSLRAGLEKEGARVAPRYTVLLKTGRTSCVRGDTRVLTRTGYIPIESVREGMQVWTHRRRWKEVTGTEVLRPQVMYSILFTSGLKLVCTAQHRLWNSRGEWVTVEELLNDYFSEMGGEPGEPASGRAFVQADESVVDSQADSRRVGHYSSQCDGGLPRDIYSAGKGVVQGDEGICREGRRQEPHEGEVQRTTPELQRGLPGSQRVLDSKSGWQEVLCSSSSDVGSAGHTSFSIAAETGGTSHQREHRRQPTGQPGAGDLRRARRDSFPTEPGNSECQVQEITRCGVFEVYDLGVTEDHSYYAGGVFNHNCSKPALQTLPRVPGARECFLPEPGHVFVSIDYSSMEMYCLAQTVYTLYGIETMLEVLRTGQDPHLYFAAPLMGKTYDETAEAHRAGDEQAGVYRQLAKIVNFGMGGGMGPETFIGNMSAAQVETLQALYPEQSVVTTIGDFKQTWIGTWGLGPFFQHASSVCRGGTRPTYTCPFTGRIKALNTYTQFCNAHFQPIAADCLKSAMSLVVESCYSEGELLNRHGARLAVEIHDELLMSGPDGEALCEWVPEVQRMMVEGAAKWLPDIAVKTEAEVCLDGRWTKKGVSVEEHLRSKA